MYTVQVWDEDKERWVDAVKCKLWTWAHWWAAAALDYEFATRILDAKECIVLIYPHEEIVK